MNIELYKSNFLEKYNPNKSIEVALSNAVKAAVQHNILYTKNLAQSERKEIRSYWFECLKSIGLKFENEVTLTEYELIISELKDKINKKFGIYFQSKSRHGSEFRISHAQKSISIYVKYLWCLNLIPEPKICPVDRIILTQTAAKSNDVAWGYVNEVSEHKRKFKYIIESAAVANLSIAKWELFLFSKF
jgi:hypothetical protein